MADSFAFRHRSREVSRLEAFSDVVFGFALTLIIVSLEVPKTFAELMHDMRGFFGFAICFAILVWVWFVHHTFFRRYGLNDGITIVLNMMLLFVVLFYVYPLKFTFAYLTGALPPGAIAERADAASLMVIYGLGFFSIFLLFFLLYAHAYRSRATLELTELETYDTVTHLVMYSSYIAIGLISALLAVFFPQSPQWGGYTFFLIGPISALIGFSRGAGMERLREVSDPVSS